MQVKALASLFMLGYIAEAQTIVCNEDTRGTTNFQEQSLADFARAANPPRSWTVHGGACVQVSCSYNQKWELCNDDGNERTIEGIDVVILGENLYNTCNDKDQIFDNGYIVNDGWRVVVQGSSGC